MSEMAVKFTTQQMWTNTVEGRRAVIIWWKAHTYAVDCYHDGAYCGTTEIVTLRAAKAAAQAWVENGKLPDGYYTTKEGSDE